MIGVLKNQNCDSSTYGTFSYTRHFRLPKTLRKSNLIISLYQNKVLNFFVGLIKVHF